MKILMAFMQSRARHSIPPYQFWEHYLRNGLQEAGHTVLEVPGVDWAEGLIYPDDSSELKQWRQRTWEATLRFATEQHKKGGIDLFLSYCFAKQVDETAIHCIRSLGVPCVNFYCDNIREFKTPPDAFRCFDLNWVPEVAALPMYRRAGIAAMWSPMPCWVAPDLRTWDHPDTYGPTFVGSWDPMRARLFAEVLTHTSALELRGSGWLEPAPALPPPPVGPLSVRIRRSVHRIKHEGLTAVVSRCLPQPHLPERATFAEVVRPAPGPEEYAQFLQQCSVVIGVNRYESYRYGQGVAPTYSRLRDLEAPMLGACYLTEACEGLSQMYDLGSEIEVYRTAEEMAEKIAILSADHKRRIALRQAAQKRALTDWSIGGSISRIADTLGLASV